MSQLTPLPADTPFPHVQTEGVSRCWRPCRLVIQRHLFVSVRTRLPLSFALAFAAGTTATVAVAVFAVTTALAPATVLGVVKIGTMVVAVLRAVWCMAVARWSPAVGGVLIAERAVGVATRR